MLLTRLRRAELHGPGVTLGSSGSPTQQKLSHSSVLRSRRRLSPWCGVLEAVDDKSCILSTGADSVEALAAQLVLTAAEFDTLDAHELIPELRTIAERLYRATH
jgi:hypothetical protein